jgi:hypothetical protein
MTLKSKISQLPSEQISWLLLIKDILKNSFNSNREHKRELIEAIEMKAVERGYSEIGQFFNANDLEEYFIN